MRLRILTWTVLPVLLAAPALSQEAPPGAFRTAVYVELLGPTEFASLNVDRRVGGDWAVRGGLQVAGSGSSLGQHYVQIPLSISRLYVLGGIGLEAGAGTVTTINGQYAWDAFEYFGSIGLRTRPFAGGAFLRAEALAIPSEQWRKTFGVGVGYAF